MNADNKNEYQAELAQDLDTENLRAMKESVADDIAKLITYVTLHEFDPRDDFPSQIKRAADRVEAWLATFRPEEV